MKFLDTNVFLRYLTRDDAVKAAACHALFQRLQLGRDEATTSETIVAEVAYVLAAKAHYGLPHDEISMRLRPFLDMRGLKVPRRQTILRALDLYRQHQFLDMEDALAVAHMERQGIREIVSYDKDFDRLPSVTRTEPQSP